MTQRCILVVDGFFDSKDVDDIKYPYYIYPTDGKVFYMGCIYNLWTDKNTGEIKDSFSIVTTDANELMAEIHNINKRMPLILHHKDIADWIDPQTPMSKVNALMVPL